MQKTKNCIVYNDPLLESYDNDDLTIAANKFIHELSNAKIPYFDGIRLISRLMQTMHNDTHEIKVLISTIESKNKITVCVKGGSYKKLTPDQIPHTYQALNHGG